MPKNVKDAYDKMHECFRKQTGHIDANIREVQRQRRVLRRKIRESRTMPLNDRFAHGKNQKQTHLLENH